MNKIIFKINKASAEEKERIIEMLNVQHENDIIVVDEGVKVIVVNDNEVQVID